MILNLDWVKNKFHQAHKIAIKDRECEQLTYELIKRVLDCFVM